MRAGDVSIHFIVPGTISQEKAIACLTEGELTRAGRFRFSNDAIHWTACRASLRQILSHHIGLPPEKVPLVLSEFGKPLLAAPYDQWHFNLSHCPNVAVVAVCNGDPVGIDLESLERGSDLLECETAFCHPEEIQTLPMDIPARASELLRIWTAKEAVLKALGTGLSHPPECVRILFGHPYGIAISDKPIPGIEALRLHELVHPLLSGYRCMLSTTQITREIRLISDVETL